MYTKLPSLVLIAQAVLLLERGQTDRQTDATECPTHARGYTAIHTDAGENITFHHLQWGDNNNYYRFNKSTQ